MRVLPFLFAALILAAGPLAAQEANEDDKTYLENLIQDSLSEAGRTVTVTGFRGALSSEATLERLTIADDDGIWLTLEDATLDWSRSALLRGRLEVEALTAGRIELSRLPVADETVTPEDAESYDFAVPELPVTVDVELIRAAEVVIGEAVMGEAARLSLEAGFLLDGGNAEASVKVQRLDRNDRLTLDAAFANDTRILAIDLAFDEAQDGIVSGLIGIPGRPELGLRITGNAPLSDYQARVALSSEGQPRFAGGVRISATGGADEITGYVFSANLDGDVRPLFSPDLQPFFGEKSALAVSGQTFADKSLTIDELRIASGALDIGGTLNISPSGWPEKFRLEGRITGEDGPVRLPVADPGIEISGAEFDARYDAGESDSWRADIVVEGFERDGLTVEQAKLEAAGTLTRGENEAVTADITFSSDGVIHRDPGLDRALGPAPIGQIKLNWRPDAPLVIELLNIVSGETNLVASAEIDSLSEGFPVTGRAALRSSDIARFADVAGRDIGGAATATAEGRYEVLGGGFDLTLDAATTNLRVGEPRADRLLQGQSDLRLKAARDTGGTRIELLEIRNDLLSADAAGRLNSQSGEMSLIATLSDIEPVEPRLSGPAKVSTELSWVDGGEVTLSLLTVEAAEAVLNARGTLNPEFDVLPATGEMTLVAGDLSRLAAIAGRPLAGAVTLNIGGSGEIRGEAFDILLRAQSRDITTGEARADRLLEGTTDLTLDARRADADGLVLDALTIRNDLLTADAQGRLRLDEAGEVAAGELTLAARLADIAAVEPRLSGPARIDTELSLAEGGEVTLDRLVAEAAEAVLNARGTLNIEDPARPVSGEMTLVANDLSRLAAVTGRSLAGRIKLDLDGAGELQGQRLDARVALDGEGFRSGIAALDKLVAGNVMLRAKAAVGDGPPFIDFLKLDTANLDINAASDAPGAPIALSARLSNLALLAPGFNGPATARGEITIRDAEGRNLGVNLTATGPGGTQAQVTGDVRDFGQSLSLGITGNAPLALANAFIAPRSIQGPATFDLQLNGPPALSSVSGQLSFQRARLAVPGVAFAIEGLRGTVTLSGGQAITDISGNTGSGGGFRVAGPVTLSAPYPADLQITLSSLGVADPNLYRTTVSGTVSVTGPLTGGARIDGALALGRTELQVPSGGGATAGTMVDVRHVAAPADVTRTLRRADLIGGGKDGSGSGPGGGGFPLNLTISAPNQIFVRGRGLDAELGGQLVLSGTTSNVVASGLFELIRGRLDILGQRLVLTEGLIDLRGALDPYLRFVAETEADEIIVRVIIEGLASSPQVIFSSEPDLPQEEIVARLLFGRGFDDISPFQAAQLVGAVATLSGRRSGGFTDRLRNTFGLSDLDITSTDTGATEFRAGAYLTENIYSEVATDSDGNQEINLNLDLTDTITVKGTAGSDGNTGLGIFFEKDY